MTGRVADAAPYVGFLFRCYSTPVSGFLANNLPLQTSSGNDRKVPKTVVHPPPELALYRGFEYDARSRTELTSIGFQAEKL